MTKLEFIDKAIKTLKENIEFLQTNENLWENQNGYDNVIFKEIRIEEQKRLQFFQQIKNDLETWEIVKKHLILDKEFHQIDLHLHHNTKDKEDYLKLKKALEVDNE